jgi:hypothetical protein
MLCQAHKRRRKGPYLTLFIDRHPPRRAGPEDESDEPSGRSVAKKHQDARA